MASLECDVAVIGGGLLGSCASTMFQRRGLSTVVLEARPPGKEQKIVVGEALTEGTSVFMRHELGLTDWLKANAYRKFGFDFLVHPRDRVPRTMDDCHELLLSLTPLEKIPTALARLIPTFHVERTSMNAHVAELARQAGARYLEGASVEHVELGASGQRHTVRFTDETGEHSVSCRWVIDASGRRQVLARQLGLTRAVNSLDTASVWNRFEGVNADPAVWKTFQGVDRRRHTIHMTGPGFWIWWIHQSPRMTSIGISYDRKQHAPNLKTEDRGFREMISKFPPILDLIGDARALEPYQAYAHLPYQSEKWIGDGWCTIGDATWFTDALYSVGIETACRQLMAASSMIEARCQSLPVDEARTAKLNHELQHLQSSVLKMNTFKYHHAWGRPHLVLQTATYELGEIAELYHLQKKEWWNEETREKHYRLQWGSLAREQQLDRFLAGSLADADRDLEPKAKRLHKALLPGPLVYRSTWPMWKFPRLTPAFFKLIRAWGYAERFAQRHPLAPDGLGIMAKGGPLGTIQRPNATVDNHDSGKLSSAPSRTPGIYDGMPDFDSLVLPALDALPRFRRATEEEITRSYEAYRAGDAQELLDVWQAVAKPVRAQLGALRGVFHRRAGMLSARIAGHSFLAAVRGALHAGKRVQAALRPATAEALREEFPWLLARHEHIPPGYTPRVEFPAQFAAWLDSGTLDDARVRWQLATALNEVQQASYSAHFAELAGEPALSRHAARERELAAHYLACWSPTVTPALWRQTIYILDALNAAVFAQLLKPTSFALIAHSALASARGTEWQQFLSGLDQPQFLWQPVRASAIA